MKKKLAAISAQPKKIAQTVGRNSPQLWQQAAGKNYVLVGVFPEIYFFVQDQEPSRCKKNNMARKKNVAVLLTRFQLAELKSDLIVSAKRKFSAMEKQPRFC